MYFFSLLFVFFLLLLEDLPLNIAKFYRLINIHFVGHFWFRFLLKTMPNPFHFLFFMNILGRMIYFKWYNTISSTLRFFCAFFIQLHPVHLYSFISSLWFIQNFFFRKEQKWEYLLVKISNNKKKAICVFDCMRLYMFGVYSLLIRLPVLLFSTLNLLQFELLE